MATRQIHARLGQRVRALRKARNWNQDDLAVESGLGRTYISNFENGLKNPNLNTLAILAATFKMTVSELLDGCG
ncbi:helix-turn-helix domain-containing protein [Edaphobacter dinghuensis]|uniref:HTH cro/C1-type domain-containing protein n=1 Tax=Edaphobacter dinghuensis TaxID=1560005 RepID=A0A917HR21_9BACT|nr:hypothetical protein GCM10011585_32850 [Edaphobacter dinghuensis]